MSCLTRQIRRAICLRSVSGFLLAGWICTLLIACSSEKETISKERLELEMDEWEMNWVLAEKKLERDLLVLGERSPATFEPESLKEWMADFRKDYPYLEDVLFLDNRLQQMGELLSGASRLLKHPKRRPEAKSTRNLGIITLGLTERRGPIVRLPISIPAGENIPEKRGVLQVVLRVDKLKNLHGKTSACCMSIKGPDGKDWFDCENEQKTNVLTRSLPWLGETATLQCRY